MDEWVDGMRWGGVCWEKIIMGGGCGVGREVVEIWDGMEDFVCDIV